jgi:hypothetical protein
LVTFFTCRRVSVGSISGLNMIRRPSVSVATKNMIPTLLRSIMCHAARWPSSLQLGWSPRRPLYKKK